MSPREIWQVAKSRLATCEPMVVFAFLVACAAGFAFLRLTSEMLEGETRDFDEAILRSLREPQDLSVPIGPEWLTKAATDVTSLGGVTVLSILTLLSVLYLVLSRKRVTALFVLFSILGGWLLSNTVKIGIARPRPDLVPHLVEVHDLSFPSGHAMLSAVAYLTLGLLVSRLQSSPSVRYFLVAAAVFLTTLVGASRVYLGVHYPTDVLGGWCAGSAWACVCWLIGRQVIPPAEKSRFRSG